MTGLVGGCATGATLSRMADQLHEESWYVRTEFETGEYGLSMAHHGKKDPAGRTVWTDGRRAGVSFGAVSNLEMLDLTVPDMFDCVLDEPTDILPRLNGSFLIVCFNAATNQFIVATDKLGSRLCYYVKTNEPLVSTSLAPLLTQIEEPTLDMQAVSDVILMSHVWGKKTLIEEIQTVPAGSVLRYRDGQTILESYYEFPFRSEKPGQKYIDELVSSYRGAVSEMASTIEGSVGLWLSGGLDSRALATALRKYQQPLHTYTYDANPAGGGNPKIARQVADRLGIDNSTVNLTPEHFLQFIDTGIRITDGMIGWKTLINISASFALPDSLDVILEASGQGGFLGYDIWQSHLDHSLTPAEALYRADHMVDREQVTELLTADVNPMDSYRTEVAKSSTDTFVNQVLDTYYRNFYSRGDFASNQLARSVAGTRVPFAHSEFLDSVAAMPQEYRARAIPLTQGTVPYGTAPLKLELARALNAGTESIPYERTKVSPVRPIWQHALGFLVTTSIQRLRQETTYGGKSMAGEWYRTHAGFRDLIDRLLNDACDRSFFDDGEIRRLQREHKNEENEHIRAISGVTTIERWLQLILD